MSALGDLVIRLTADTADLRGDMGKTAAQIERDMQRIEKAATKIGTGLVTGALAAGGALVAMAKSAIDSADGLSKMSQSVGVSVEELSALQYAAKLSDVSNEQLASGLKALSAGMLSAQAGTGKALAAFQALGIEVESTKGVLKPTQVVLEELADKFANMEDGAGKTALAMRIFKGEGAALLPLLNGGAKGLRDSAEEARRFGIIITTELSKAAEQFKDNLTRVQESSKSLGIGIANEALPWLNKMVEQMLEGTRIAGGFAKAVNLFGLSTITSDNAGKKIQEINAELEKLAQRRREIAAQPGRSGWLPEIDREISDAQKRLEFAKFLQRQAALEIGPKNYRDEGAKYAVGGKVKAPALADKDGKSSGMTFEETLALQAQARARYNDELAQQADQLAKSYQEQAQRLREQLDPLEKVRQQLLKINELEEKGFLTLEEAEQLRNDVYSKTHEMLGGTFTWQEKVKEQTDELKTMWRDLGFVMSSSFERAIVQGGRLSGVLAGLAQDIAKIVFTQTVANPIGNAVVKGLQGVNWGGLFGGSPTPTATSTGLLSFDTPGRAVGGPVMAGGAYLVGENGPELFVPNVGGKVVANGQRKNGGSGSGSGDRQTTIINADLRGADVAAVRKLEQFVSRLGAQVSRMGETVYGSWR